jgi:DNA adenine methylase
MDAAMAVEVANLSSPRALEIRPPLKWAGGKRWQVPLLRPFWLRHRSRRLVEPFCGGLAVTLGLCPERALLNDVNPHLVNFYRWLQRGLRAALPMENLEAVYYRHRRRFNALLRAGEEESQEAAELFYYLNRTGYNGLCRFNASGGFNVPFGRYKAIGYRSDFRSYEPVLGGWSFRCGDVAEVPLERGDFVYADPPYDVPFTTYSKGGFGWEDQERTAERLSRHRGPVILSNQATDRILDLYRKLGFKLKTVDAPRRISCTGDRRPALEVIAVRNL